MKVIEVNEGPKVSYEVDKTRVTFNDELMLNLAKYEQDDDVHIDICADKNGNLSTATAFRYVAQIEIPARQYREVEPENPDYNPENEDSLKTIVKKEAISFSLDNVTLKFYSLN